MHRRVSWLTVALLLSALLLSACGGAKPAQNTSQPAQSPAAGSAPAGPAWKPEKPITMVVQYAAGGGVDVTARIIAKAVEKVAGQPVPVVNKTGGSGVVGMTEVANAKPDGYTLGIAIHNMFTDQYLVKGVTYNEKSFIPIAQLVFEPNVMVVKKGGPLDKPLKEIIEYAKANPGKLRIGVAGNWSTHDFTRAAFEKAAGIRAQRVPFDGGAPAVAALLAGDIDVAVPYISEVRSGIEGGKLTGVAVADTQRFPVLKDVPTFAELGLQDVSFGVWRTVVVPKGTPEPVVQALSDMFKKAMEDPETKDAYAKAGMVVTYKDAKAAAEFIAEDHAKFKKLIDELQLKPQ